MSHEIFFSLDDGSALGGHHDDWVPTLGPLQLELSIEIILKET